MPIVTKLSIQKNQKISNVFIDAKFAFGLSIDAIYQEKLSVGLELSDQQLQDLIYRSFFEKFYQRTINFLSFRPRSIKEVKDYLKKVSYRFPGILPITLVKIQKAIFQKLEKLKLIDDYKFSLWWLEQRLQFNPKSKRVIELELAFKGIDKNIIDDVLSTVADNKFYTLINQIIKKKIAKFNHLNKFEQRKKIFAYLARRGFDFELINKAIDESLEK